MMKGILPFLKVSDIVARKRYFDEDFVLLMQTNQNQLTMVPN